LRGPVPGAPMNLTRGAVLLLVILCAAAWFAPLGIRSLLPSEEGHYAEIAREMLASGDWTTPRYNGAPYGETAPLQIWATAASFALFGLGEWQARLWTALCGFGAILLVGYTGVRLFGRPAGILAAAAMVATPYWHLFGHYASRDMGLSAMLTVVLCTFLLAQRAPHPAIGQRDMSSTGGKGVTVAVSALRGQRGWMWLCWAAMALALLSKGLTGIAIPALALVIYSLAGRDARVWRRLHLFSGLLVFLALCAPWFIASQWHHPDASYIRFGEAADRRFRWRDNTLPDAISFVVPVLLIGILPWLSLLWQGMRRAIRLPRQTNRFSPAVLLLTWSISIFVFFSLSDAKRVADLLPLTPAVALVVGAYLPSRDPRRIRRHLAGYAVLLITLALSVVYLSNFGSVTTPNALYRRYQMWLWLALGVGLLGFAVAGALARRLGARAWLVYVAAWYATLAIAVNAHELLGRPIAGTPLAARVRSTLAQTPDGAADWPFYALGGRDETIAFALRRTMIGIDMPDNTVRGASPESDAARTALAQWAQHWRDGGPALAIMTPAQYDALRADNVPMTVIANDPRRVVVSRDRP